MNQRYNKDLHKVITLEKGEIFCPKCNGKGRVPHKSSNLSLRCNQCSGKGKLDWIEQITNK